MAISSLVLSSGNLLIYTNKDTYSVTPDHPNYKQIVEALSSRNEEAIDTLCDIPKAVQQFTSGRVEIRDGNVFWGGELLHNIVCERILDFLSRGLPFQPLVNFLDKLQDNPSKHSVDQLYSFLERNGLPVCDDGDFLSFKCVRNSYYDKHSNTVLNTPGSVIEMRRNQVNEDARVGCSVGYHVGSKDYVNGFKASGDRVLMVKVNPRDAVAVPTEDCNKMRVCRYEVVKEMDWNESLEKPLYSNEGSEVESGYDEGFDDGFETALSRINEFVRSE